MKFFNHAPVDRKIWPWIALAVLVVVAISMRVTLIITSLRVLQPSSDESIFALMAVSIREGERPLLYWTKPYLFPIESYLMAPFAHKLTPDSLGSRLPLLLMQQVAFLLQVALAFLLFRRPITRAISLALVLFPSSYLMMLQSLYSIPGYAYLMMAGFAILVAAALGDKLNIMPLAGLLIGVLAGLGFAVHQLILIFAVPAILFVVLQSLYKSQFLLTSLATGTGAIAGLVPFWLAKQRMPGSHSAFAEWVPISEFAQRIWKMALSTTWPETLGLRLVPFPDQPAIGEIPEFIASAVPFAFAVFIAAGCLSVATGVVGSKEDTWKHPLILLRSVLWVAIALNFLVFGLFKYIGGECHRHLVPAASLLPFLMADLASRIRVIAPVIVAITISLVGLNLYRMIELHSIWTSTNLTAKYVAIPDLRPPLEILESLGIRRAVASYGAAYRINWQSGREIIACQPINEHFPKWPIPYEEKVWSGQQLAYVLHERIPLLTPSVFERHLHTEGVTVDIINVGGFNIYHNFRYDPPDEPLSYELITISCSPNQHHAYRLLDRRIDTYWSTLGEMKRGDSIHLKFMETQTVTRLVLHYMGRGQDVPQKYKIQFDGSNVDPHIETARLSKFVLRDGLPRYGMPVQMIRFSPTKAQGITISVAEPQQRRPWSVTDLQVFVMKSPSIE